MQQVITNQPTASRTEKDEYRKIDSWKLSSLLRGSYFLVGSGNSTTPRLSGYHYNLGKAGKAKGEGQYRGSRSDAKTIIQPSPNPRRVK